MLRLAALAFVATVLVSAGAHGQTAQDQPPPAKERQLDPNERICKTTNKTGSRLKKDKVCMSRADWDRVKQDTDRAVSNMQSKSMPSSGQ